MKSKLIIGIDGNEANVVRRVGVSIYTKNLLYYFAKEANESLNFKIFLRQQPITSLPAPSNFFHYEIVFGPALWSQIFLPFCLYRQKNIDIFFSPAHYTPRFCPAPIIVTIHDLAYEYFPDEFLTADLYKLKNWTTHALKLARQIIAVSKTTKKDLIKFYNIPEEKISVIYNGYEIHKAKGRGSDILKKYQLSPLSYILYVGTLQPRKNLPFLIRVFAQYHKENPETKLVIVGKKGWLYNQIFAEVKKYHLEKQTIFTDYINDNDLTVLYRQAFCLIHPSLYEGFGIPILEAMANNCPVIASHAASLPEIGGDACLYFDPHDERDLLEDIVRLKNNLTLRKELITKGRLQIKKFSWTKCAKETLELLIATTYVDQPN